MLSKEVREKLIASSQAVFQAYLALDFAHTAAAQINNKPAQSLIECLNNYLSDPLLPNDNYIDIKINNIACKLSLKRSHLNNEWLINITKSDNANFVLPSTLKRPDDYTAEEKLALVAAHSFKLQKNALDQWVLGTDLKDSRDQTYSIGGIDEKGNNKLPLYRTHLMTLYNIINNLKDQKSLKSILIALATGSGKTFIQALWFLVLKHANVGGIFALPEQLIKQFKKDFKKLLPEDVVNDIKELEPNDNLGLKFSNNNTDLNPSANFIIGSCDKLLDEHYDELNQLTGDQAIICFDEQHLPMRQESRKLKIIELAKKKLCLFLTATPDQYTYEKLCGKKPVALMTSKQKEEAGQGKFPKIQVFRPKSLSEKLSLIKKKGIAAEIGFIDRIKMSIIDSLIPSVVSPLTGLLEELQSTPREKFENAQHPLESGPILVTTNDIDEIVNLDRFIKQTDELGDFSPKVIIRGEGKQAPTDEELKYIRNTFFIFKDVNGLKYVFIDETGDKKDEAYINTTPQRFINELIKEERKTVTDSAKDIEIPYSAFWNFGEPKIQQTVYQNGNVQRRKEAYKLFNIFKESDDDCVDSKIIQNFRLKKEIDSGRYLTIAKTMPQTLIPNTYLLTKYKDTHITGSRLEWTLFYIDASGLKQNICIDTIKDLRCIVTSLDNQLNQENTEIFKRRIQDILLKHNNLSASISLAKRLDKTIFSGMVEFILCHFSGLSAIELNALRQDENKFQNFIADFNEKLLNLIDHQTYPEIQNLFKNKLLYDADKNPQGIDSEGAESVSEMLVCILREVKALINVKKSVDQKNFIVTINNRYQSFFYNKTNDFNLFDWCLKKQEFKNIFEKFADKNRLLVISTGLAKAEVPLEPDKTFSGFQEKIIKMKNPDKSLSSQAKVRARTPFESVAVDDEYYYSPISRDIPEHIADNYFLLGLCGMYAGNKKGIGFNSQVQTVISSAPSSKDMQNNPAQAIQTLGRARGLDPTKQYYYYQAVGKNNKSFFDLRQLNTHKNFYGDYFSSQAQYHQSILKDFGNEIAEEIYHWLNENKDEYQNIDTNAFEIARQKIIFNVFRKINDNNQHDIVKSRQDFKTALKYADKALSKLINSLEKSAKPPFFVRTMLFLLTPIMKLTAYLKTFSLKKAIKKAAETEHYNPSLQLYDKILNRLTYQTLQSHANISIKITDVFFKEKPLIEKAFLHHIKAVIKNNNKKIQDYNNAFQKILYILVKFIQPIELHAAYLEEAKKYEHLYELFFDHLKLIEKFEEASDEEKADISLMLFSKIPALKGKLSSQNKFIYNEKLLETIYKTMESNIEKAVKQGTVENLAAFLAGDFLHYSYPLLLEQDYEVVSGILNNPENAKYFSEYLCDQSALSTPEQALILFKSAFTEKFPAVQQIAFIDDAVRNINESLESISANIKEAFKREQPEEYFSDHLYTVISDCLQEGKKVKINSIFNQTIIPALCKFYPVNEQDKILALSQKNTDWPALLFKNASALKRNIENNLDEKSRQKNFLAISHTILSSLVLDLLPQRDYEKICVENAAAIKESIKSIMTSAIQKPGNYFWAAGSFLQGKANFTHGLCHADLDPYLKNEFLIRIEPFFIPEHLKIFKECIVNNKTNSKNQTFTYYLIEKLFENQHNIEGLTEKDILGWLQLFLKEAGYKEDIQFAPSFLKSGADELRPVMEEITDSLSDSQAQPSQVYPNECFKQDPQKSPGLVDALLRNHAVKFEKLIRDEVLPVWKRFFKPKSAALIQEKCNECKDLLKKFFIFQEKFQQVPDKEKINIILELFQTIPGLEILTQNDLDNPFIAKQMLEENLKNIKDITTPNPYTTDAVKNAILNDILPLFQQIVVEPDYIIIKNILKKNNNTQKFAEILLKNINNINNNIDNNIDKRKLLINLFKTCFEQEHDYNNLNLTSEGLIKFTDQWTTDIKKNIIPDLQKLNNSVLNQISVANKHTAIENVIIPILKLPEFRQFIIDIINGFSSKEIISLLFYINPNTNNNFDQEARDIINFLSYLKKDEYQNICNDFINAPLTKLFENALTGQGENDAQIQNTPFFKILNNIQDIYQEQQRLHMYYQDFSMVDVGNPKIIPNNDNTNKFLKMDDTLYDQLNFATTVFHFNGINENLKNIAGIEKYASRAVSGFLRETQKNFISPLAQNIAAKKIVVEPKADAKGLKKLIVSINKLTSLTPKVIKTTKRKDAIDVLFDDIKEKENRTSGSPLREWWYAKSHAANSPRAADTLKLDHLINHYNHCDNNNELILIYDKALKWVNSNFNLIISSRDIAVYNLIKNVYNRMALNSFQKNPAPYNNAITHINTYFSNYNLDNNKSETDTLKIIFKVLENKNFSNLEKLIKLQELAIDYEKDSFHNINRKMTHLFSDIKRNERKIIKNLFDDLKKTCLFEYDSHKVISPKISTRLHLKFPYKLNDFNNQLVLSIDNITNTGANLNTK